MRKVFLLFLLILVTSTLIVFAEQYPPQKIVGQPSLAYPSFPIAIGEFVDNWTARKTVYLFNMNGDTLKAGDVVVWDYTEVAVVDTFDASGAGSGTYDTCTIADSIKHYTWHKLYVYFSNPSNDTVVIVGKDSANATQTETVVKASGAGLVYSTNFWRKVTLAYVKNSNGNIGINSVPYAAVEKTTSVGSQGVAGVVQAQALNDSLVKVIINGLASVKVAGASTRVTPGAWIGASSTSGYGIPVTDIQSAFAVALESGNTNTTYLCYVNPFALPKWLDSGTSTFTAEKTNDTILITGATSNDVYWIQGLGSTPWVKVPTYTAKAGTLIVHVATDDTAKARASGIYYLRLQ